MAAPAGRAASHLTGEALFRRSCTRGWGQAALGGAFGTVGPNRGKAGYDPLMAALRASLSVVLEQNAVAIYVVMRRQFTS